MLTPPKPVLNDDTDLQFQVSHHLSLFSFNTHYFDCFDYATSFLTYIYLHSTDCPRSISWKVSVMMNKNLSYNMVPEYDFWSYYGSSEKLNRMSTPLAGKVNCRWVCIQVYITGTPDRESSHLAQLVNSNSY